MVETIARGSRNLETCSHQLRFKNDGFILERFGSVKKQTFYNCFHNYLLSEADLVG